ncbi:TPA: PIG-L family deacetylase [Clostridioides difficile]|uniref:PIG-L family deacetylase n=1 Tax=Clostridioides difficile TaxID=1496 RepID=UPI00093A33F1|nr:PIG-L family deacetylase [Clostridioides difficile]EGT5080366.1 PIG-L family deacetylase [Clostridioides difficile]EGT5137572.1 PIG-L family deacetylase [Clostridioides difficile]EGT5282982.1 PIG-L family deacetylase [Clostridioides difficile]MBG0213342.1 PIG-L family deacetylase [Clostridioides difficile]MBY1736374.1 PIG-L family deacetylase [Clostridioides difficile]
MVDATLFFTPHQDDETLSMGSAIIEHVEKSDTHVILCTDGSKSIVRKVLDDGGSCSYHIKDVHKYSLSENELSKDRDEEFKNSCEAMGVKESNIHIEDNRAHDGELSKEKAKEIILKYLEEYPEAKVKTVTPFKASGIHEDHRALGEAALELYREGKIKDLRFYVEPYDYKDFKKVNPNVEVWKVLPSQEEKLLSAMNAYKKWNPESGHYAIGYHSVKSHFDDLELNKTQYVHAP